jgi:ATP-dependent protease Clp ATPase subunit
VIDEPVLCHIVGESLRRETGARGLASVLTRHIEDAAFESFAEMPGGRIKVSLDGDRIQVATEASGR